MLTFCGPRHQIKTLKFSNDEKDNCTTVYETDANDPHSYGRPILLQR